MKKWKKWVKLSYLASICNPLPTGLVAGILLVKEKDKIMKKHGKIVILISLIWSAFLLGLVYLLIRFYG